MIGQEISKSLNLDAETIISGTEQLPSCFAVTELAANSIAAVGVSVAQLLEGLNLVAEVPRCNVDQRLASLWFDQSIRPIDWEMPPIWDAIAGDYRAKDGWIKLHTNLPHHRVAALSILKCGVSRSEVASVVKSWSVNALEDRIVGAGGVAAAMRSRKEWAEHPQGIAIENEPLIGWNGHRKGQIEAWQPTRSSPLSGLKVLDLTRVLAGPVATRTLAGFGASVLRVDPFGWNEANVVPDITLGKHCCNLNLKESEGRRKFTSLLSEAHVLVHGYRPDALEHLGLGLNTRSKIAPNIVEVKLNAYGWQGPWKARRGFDSLVQMSCGIAHTGMAWARQDKPTPLPVQALDHATGYLMAASVIHAVDQSVRGEGLTNAQLSLARVASLLMDHPQKEREGAFSTNQKSDYSVEVERSSWGNSYRLNPPIMIEGTNMHWTKAACELGSSEPKF